MMERITFSDEGLCAKSLFCFLPNKKKEAKLAWINKHDLYISENNRVFALVESSLGQCYMDAITGSLYKDGRCLTSPRLSYEIMQKDTKNKAHSILLSKKSIGGDDGLR